MDKSIGFEKGKTYYCGYWGRKHRIIDILENGDVVSEWEAQKNEPKHTTTHHTPFDKKRDYIVE